MPGLVEFRKALIAGAARSTSSLSPQARKVWRRQLLQGRALRQAGVEPVDRAHLPRSNMQRRLDLRSQAYRGNVPEAASELDMQRRLGAAPVRPTRVRNLSISADADAGAQARVEAAAGGRRFKHPVSVHTSTPAGVELPAQFGGANMPAPVRGRTQVLMAPKGAVVGGQNPRMLAHELTHAQPGRKGRLLGLDMRRDPGAVMAREEARADAMGERLAPVARRRNASGYASIYGGSDRDEYRRVFRAVAGRAPRPQSKGRDVSTAARMTGLPKGDVNEMYAGQIEMMGGSRVMPHRMASPTRMQMAVSQAWSRARLRSQSQQSRHKAARLMRGGPDAAAAPKANGRRTNQVRAGFSRRMLAQMTDGDID